MNLDPKTPDGRKNLIFLWKNKQTFSAALRYRLKAQLERIKTAKGESKSDYLYDQAPEVVFKYASPDGKIFRVDIWYDGAYYQNCDVSWGPLDGDKDKSTVMIRTNKKPRKWVKLWFFDKDVRAG